LHGALEGGQSPVGLTASRGDTCLEQVRFRITWRLTRQSIRAGRGIVDAIKSQLQVD
jgi:hypothetical protein